MVAPGVKPIGVVLNTIEATMRTENLLAQSQRLTAELQAQQGELKKTNDRLEQQAASLQQSEELLKNQQEELRKTNEELEDKAQLLSSQKKQVEVYIDTDREVEDRPGKTIGDYAYTIHEHLTPAGLMQLGPKSALKQAGQREVVGGAFLDRAVEAVIGNGSDEELMDILRDFM